MEDRPKSRDVSHEIIQRGGDNDVDIAERIWWKEAERSVDGVWRNIMG